MTRFKGFLTAFATRLPISQVDFYQEEKLQLDSCRRLFLPFPISLVYFTLSLSPLDFRWLESIPTIDDLTLCGYIGQTSDNADLR